MDKPIVSNWKQKCLDHLEKIKTNYEISECKESSPELLKRKEIVEKKIVLQKEEIKQIQKQIDDLNAECDMKDINKYRMQLYELITNIRWDPESLPNEVKGFISKPFNVFNLDTEVHSKYFISNYLWDLISEEEVPNIADLKIEDDKTEDNKTNGCL